MSPIEIAWTVQAKSPSVLSLSTPSHHIGKPPKIYDFWLSSHEVLSKFLQKALDLGVHCRKVALEKPQNNVIWVHLQCLSS